VESLRGFDRIIELKATYASSRGNLSILEILLSRGANVNAQGREHGDVLQAASYQGHEKIVDLLLNKGNALQAASYGGHEKIVDLLLNKGAENTPKAECSGDKGPSMP
jgi:ankyrin repeat protein